MHPHHLHATAAAWSLHNARTALTTRAEEEAAAIGAELLVAADGLRSWVPTIGGRSSGGHGDPAGHGALRMPRTNEYAALAERTDATLAWLADSLNVPGTGDPLRRLQAAIPQLLPGTAVTLHRWLAEADDRIRLALGLAPDRERLGGAECPGCAARRLVVLTAAPDPAAWTVTCEAGCRCTGAGCRCGMPGAVEGVAHIWLRTAVIAGVTPAAA
jgi:hypothetical protein